MCFKKEKNNCYSLTFCSSKNLYVASENANFHATLWTGSHKGGTLRLGMCLFLSHLSLTLKWAQTGRCLIESCRCKISVCPVIVLGIAVISSVIWTISVGRIHRDALYTFSLLLTFTEFLPTSAISPKVISLCYQVLPSLNIGNYTQCG